MACALVLIHNPKRQTLMSTTLDALTDDLLSSVLNDHGVALGRPLPTLVCKRMRAVYDPMRAALGREDAPIDDVTVRATASAFAHGCWDEARHGRCLRGRCVEVLRKAGAAPWVLVGRAGNVRALRWLVENLVGHGHLSPQEVHERLEVATEAGLWCPALVRYACGTGLLDVARSSLLSTSVQEGHEASTSVLLLSAATARSPDSSGFVSEDFWLALTTAVVAFDANATRTLLRSCPTSSLMTALVDRFVMEVVTMATAEACEVDAEELGAFLDVVGEEEHEDDLLLIRALACAETDTFDRTLVRRLPKDAGVVRELFDRLEQDLREVAMARFHAALHADA